MNPLIYVPTGPLDVIDVDWSSLMPKQKQEPRAAGAALLRFTPGAVLLRAGISKRLAGPELLEQVREVCKSELDDPKGEFYTSCNPKIFNLGFVQSLESWLSYNRCVFRVRSMLKF